MKNVNASELKHMLENGESRPLLLDVREPWEYEHCHIEGSRLLPLAKLHEGFEGYAKDATIVVVCHHGIRSYNAASFLERQGFTDVINLEGGIDAWARDVDPNMPTY